MAIQCGCFAEPVGRVYSNETIQEILGNGEAVLCFRLFTYMLLLRTYVCMYVRILLFMYFQYNTYVRTYVYIDKIIIVQSGQHFSQMELIPF